MVSLLARRDALFWPWRQPHIPAQTRQRDYLTRRVGVSAKASGQSDWKAAFETRSELIASGRATAAYSGGQVTSLFLTPQGELDARRMVGKRLATLEEVEPCWLRLQELPGIQFGGNKLVHESELFDHPCEGPADEWDDFTEAVLPLLTAGLVEARCDTQKRICYQIRDGATWPASFPQSDVVPVAGMDDAYCDQFDAENAFLSDLVDHSGGIAMPLPAGTGVKLPQLEVSP